MSPFLLLGALGAGVAIAASKAKETREPIPNNQGRATVFGNNPVTSDAANFLRKRFESVVVVNPDAGPVGAAEYVNLLGMIGESEEVTPIIVLALFPFGARLASGGMALVQEGFSPEAIETFLQRERA